MPQLSILHLATPYNYPDPFSPWFTPMTLGGGVLALVGLVLLIIGWRGRRVSDHPYCRSCGFDLYQRYPDAETCPECGESLASPSAVVQGRREHRPLIVVLGVAVLLIGLAPIGLTTVSNLTGYDWIRIKPVAWLRADASTGSQSALIELNRRLHARELTPTQISQITNDALGQQTLPPNRWQPMWGNFVEDAHSMGYVSKTQWGIYGFNILNHAPVLEVRPSITRGDHIVVGHKGGPTPCGDQRNLWLVIRGGNYQIKDQSTSTQKIFSSSGGIISPASSGVSAMAFAFPEDWDATLADGRHTIETNWTLELYEGSGGPLITRKSITVSDDFDLLPGDQPSARAVLPEEHRKSVEAAITPRAYTRKYDSGTTRYLYVQLNIKKRPVGIAFHITAQTRDGQTLDLGKFAFAPSSESGSHSQVVVEKMSGDTIDLTLTPSYEAATQSMQVTDYWGDVIEIKDVPVEHN